MGLIYLDSCLLIYLIEQHARWAPAVAAALASAGRSRFALSPLVECECLVGALRRNDPVLQQAYREAFTLFVTLPMPEAVYLQAAELRAHFGIKTRDALHLACAQQHRCASFWTNDDRLARASHGMAHNVAR